jgi:hypothetical protein
MQSTSPIIEYAVRKDQAKHIESLEKRMKIIVGIFTNTERVGESVLGTFHHFYVEVLLI